MIRFNRERKSTHGHIDTEGKRYPQNTTSESHEAIAAESIAELPTTAVVELPTPTPERVLELPTTKELPAELCANNHPVHELSATELVELPTNEPIAETSTTDAQAGEKDLEHSIMAGQAHQEPEASYSWVPEPHQSPSTFWNTGFSFLPPRDSSQQPLPSRSDASNLHPIQPAPVSHVVHTPNLPVDRPSSMMAYPNPRHQPALRRGASLTLNVMPPYHFRSSQFQQVQLTPLSSASAYGSDQSSVSPFSNSNFPSELSTPATPALSCGGDSGCHSATSPLHNGLSHQDGLVPGDDALAGGTELVLFECLNHKCPVMDCPLLCLDIMLSATLIEERKEQIPDTQIIYSDYKTPFTGCLQRSKCNLKRTRDSSFPESPKEKIPCNFNEEYKEHIPDSQMICPDCKMSFTGSRHDSKRNLKRHCDFSCPKNPREKLPCRVEGCESRFARSDGRNKHEKKAHGYVASDRKKS
ncbi:uncharacterized protein BKCO1_1400089 [Diplodia corticola]|uniref:C2H2-type domain-containing protein n=1 Tax=Diplodia corticola TaxID=236234 RepID=A0A1J9S673_9PEZI|nr:uncharacterized protein BKCO1_1400089 [Diplodia corticola]OJD36023.1 hypothetical protein BKCO1_1400089 [Diplodia corticola]